MSTLPDSEWTHLSADFLGPIHDGSYLLVIIDEYSRFPIVEIIRSTSARAVIPVIDRVFAMLGTCTKLKTDNGPPWNSVEMDQFAKYLGFQHQRITPVWPQADAMPERAMKTIAKILRTARIEGKNWKQELFTFLRAYRSTPHSTTQKSPAELLLHRKMKTSLPQIDTNRNDDADIRRKDERAKTAMKTYADKRRHAKPNQLQIGEEVLVKIPKTDKLSSYYNPKPYNVTEIKGTMITASCGNHSITRNASFFKKLNRQNQPVNQPMNITDDNSTDDDEIVAHREERPQQLQQAQPQQPIIPMNNHGQFGQHRDV